LSAEERRVRRTLILCVDRDNDLGVKAGIKTPIVGKDANLEAATTLAMSDPEEADANAMFEAVRLYERLRESASPYEDYEVATIAGSEVGGIEADRKVAEELAKVQELFPADGVILVTDGYSDEDIYPLIHSRIPVTSVRRIVVKHSRSIEETAALFSRYAKMLVEDPRYSKLFLGIPGVFMLVLAVLWYLNLLLYGWITFLVLFGAALVIKGFKLERLFRRLPRRRLPVAHPTRSMSNFLYLAGGLTVIVGVYQGASYIYSYVLPSTIIPAGTPWALLLPKLTGLFLLRSSILIVAGVCLLILGKTIHWLLLRSQHFWYGIVSLIACAWFQKVLQEAALLFINPSLPYTGLMISITLGISLISASIILLNSVRQRYRRFFEGEAVES